MVMSIIEPSEKLPVATNACDAPAAMVADAGVMVIDCSVALETVTLSLPVTPMYVALMVAVPRASGDRPPLVPNWSDTAATPGADDTQVASCVRSWVVLSE